MRTPKPPIGFVPVDSDEARGIPASATVNVAIANGSIWKYQCRAMSDVLWEISNAPDADAYKEIMDMHYHVQLPPAVEWEEVWEWDKLVTVFDLKYRGITVAQLDRQHFVNRHMDTIVRALNEMEGK